MPALFAAAAAAAATFVVWPPHPSSAQTAVPDPGGVASVAAAPDAAPKAGPDRWHETAYGISLVPPAGWTPRTVPRNGDDFAWTAPAGARLSFKIAYSKTPVDLDLVSSAALVEMGFALDGPRLRGNVEQRRLGDRPGAVMVFDVAARDTGNVRPAAAGGDAGDHPDARAAGDRVYAHAIVMLEPYAAAVVRLTAPAAQGDAALLAFARTLSSLHVPLAETLEARRTAQIARGEAWRRALPPGALAAALPADAWFRLEADGRDLGHRRVRSLRSADEYAAAADLVDDLQSRGFRPPGRTLVVQERRRTGGSALDRLLLAWATPDDAEEIWDFRQTLRPDAPADAADRGLPAAAATASTITWVETGSRGLRSRPGRRPLSVLEVVHDVPPAAAVVREVLAQEAFLGDAGAAALRDDDGRPGRRVAGRTHRRSWPTPDVGYVSLADAAALPAALARTPAHQLPPGDDATLAFYAWDPNAARLALRTVRLGPDPENPAGGRIVYERVTPHSAELRHRFDADGVHLETIDPAGMRRVRTTAEALRQRQKDAAGPDGPSAG